MFIFIYVLHYEYYIAYNWHAHTFTLYLFLHCLCLIPRACFLNRTSLTHISPSSFCFFRFVRFFVELLFELRAIKIITIEYTIGCQSTHSHTFHRTNGINVSAARPLLLLSSQRNSCPTFPCNMHGHGSRTSVCACVCVDVTSSQIQRQRQQQQQQAHLNAVLAWFICCRKLIL